MWKTIIISPDEEICDRLEELLQLTGRFASARTVPRYPSAQDLGSMLKSTAPQMVFVSGDQPDRLAVVAGTAASILPNIQVLAICRSSGPSAISPQTKIPGVAEFLALPFEEAAVRASLERVEQSLNRHPVVIPNTNLVFSCLPAKPGVGASTVAANLAFAAGRLTTGRGLLLDCDQSNGIVQFLLQLEKRQSLLDAARHAFELDENIWPQFVTPIENLDVIHSGSIENELRIEPSQIRQILEYARRQYDVIMLDLSGSMERYSVPAMEESKQIFLVVTPELSSLHMARQKLRYMRKIGLEDRIAVLVNRTQKKSIVSPEQIADVLRVPVAATFLNDYQRVNFALTIGKPVDAASELGVQFSSHAAAMIRKVTSEQKNRITDYLLSTSKSLFSSEKRAPQ